jgi:hypothetical protein
VPACSQIAREGLQPKINLLLHPADGHAFEICFGLAGREVFTDPELPTSQARLNLHKGELNAPAVHDFAFWPRRLFAVRLCSPVSSIHRSISDATTSRLGRWGFMVPAMTLNPSDNIALANCLASISVGNDFDCLGEGARNEAGRRRIGLSIETYQ